MFNSDLTPMFDGCVMMNENAKHDEAVMNVLQTAQAEQFQFKGTWGDRYSIDEWRTSYDYLHDGALGDYPEE
jgi:hypothetical protein|tara:strand:+ start:499 stop:714 length:216 start_codon:yes stop_codon:yes gene_type:complete